MTKNDIVSEYEKKHNIPEKERYMVYISQYECYMPKMGIAEELIEERYEQAKAEEDAEEKKKKYLGIYKITGLHNLEDKSTYAAKNFDNMLKAFYTDKYKKKELGVEIEGEYYGLLSIREDQKYPEYVAIKNFEQKDTLLNIQREWFLNFVEQDNNELIRETTEVSELSEYLMPKQKINYTRELKKIKETRKCFTDSKLDGYDFREIICDNTFFFNCSLKKANFSHVNLQNTVFVNCDTTDAIFLGANLNGCIKVTGNTKEIKDKYKKFTKGEK